MKKTEPGLMIAMVALSERALPPAAKIFAFLNKTWNDVPKVSGLTRDNDVVAFKFSGGIGSIGLIPAPIPWSDLEGPCKTAWYWPEAGKMLRDHKAHVIVGLTHKSLQPTAMALLLTKLVASVAATTESLGVYWGAGTLVQSTETFLEQSEGISAENMPLTLWIDFRLQREANRAVTLFTTGMKAFGFMEIEAEKAQKDPKYLLGSVYNIAHYLLEHGPIVKDGDTIGASAGGRIKVRHAPSMWDKSKKVYRLTFP